MEIGRTLGTLEVYDRFSKGKKVSESYWDYTMVPTNASMMKKKYGIKFDDRIIPDDRDMTDRLFRAGMDMLVTTGFYCPDLSRVLNVTEEEVLEGINRAPKKVKLGCGKDSVSLEARHGRFRIRTPSIDLSIRSRQFPRGLH